MKPLTLAIDILTPLFVAAVTYAIAKLKVLTDNLTKAAISHDVAIAQHDETINNLVATVATVTPIDEDGKPHA